MAVVGEVSAIIGIVEFGFSFASALNTYVSDVSSARGAVTSLCSEVEATCAHLRSLEALMHKNETTHAWDDDGLLLAKRAIGDCDQIMRQLRSLVRKAAFRHDYDDPTDLDGNGKPIMTFDAKEIDLGLFEKALWPRVKPDFEMCKSRLQMIKTDILLVHNAYMIGITCGVSTQSAMRMLIMSSTTESERTKYRDAIKGLGRARKWNAQKMKRTRDKRARVREQVDFGFAGEMPNGNPGPCPPSAAPFYVPSPNGPGFYADDAVDNELQEDFERFLDEEEEKQIEAEREFVLAQEAKKKAEEKEQLQLIEKRAVEAYLLEQTKKQKEIEEKRDLLRSNLEERGALTQQQIDMILDMVHPGGQWLSRPTGNATGADISQAMVIARRQSTPSIRSDSSGRRSRFSLGRFFRNSNTSSQADVRIRKGTPSIWRDATTRSGYANLESWFIASEGPESPPRVAPAPIPTGAMLKRLIQAEQEDPDIEALWEKLLSLSPITMNEIHQLLKARAKERPSYDWSVVWIDAHERPTMAPASVKFGPLKMNVRVQSRHTECVYVMLRYEENSRGRQAYSSGKPSRAASTDSATSSSTTSALSRDISPVRAQPVAGRARGERNEIKLTRSSRPRSTRNPDRSRSRSSSPGRPTRPTTARAPHWTDENHETGSGSTYKDLSSPYHVQTRHNRLNPKSPQKSAGPWPSRPTTSYTHAAWQMSPGTPSVFAGGYQVRRNATGQPYVSTSKPTVSFDPTSFQEHGPSPMYTPAPHMHGGGPTYMDNPVYSNAYPTAPPTGNGMPYVWPPGHALFDPAALHPQGYDTYQPRSRSPSHSRRRYPKRGQYDEGSTSPQRRHSQSRVRTRDYSSEPPERRGPRRPTVERHRRGAYDSASSYDPDISEDWDANKRRPVVSKTYERERFLPRGERGHHHVVQQTYNDRDSDFESYKEWQSKEMKKGQRGRMPPGGYIIKCYYVEGDDLGSQDSDISQRREPYTKTRDSSDSDRGRGRGNSRSRAGQGSSWRSDRHRSSRRPSVDFLRPETRFGNRQATAPLPQFTRQVRTPAAMYDSPTMEDSPGQGRFDHVSHGVRFAAPERPTKEKYDMPYGPTPGPMLYHPGSWPLPVPLQHAHPYMTAADPRFAPMGTTRVHEVEDDDSEEDELTQKVMRSAISGDTGAANTADWFYELGARASADRAAGLWSVTEPPRMQGKADVTRASSTTPYMSGASKEHEDRNRNGRLSAEDTARKAKNKEHSKKKHRDQSKQLRTKHGKETKRARFENDPDTDRATRVASVKDDARVVEVEDDDGASDDPDDLASRLSKKLSTAGVVDNPAEHDGEKDKGKGKPVDVDAATSNVGETLSPVVLPPSPVVSDATTSSPPPPVTTTLSRPLPPPETPTTAATVWEQKPHSLEDAQEK